MKRSDPHITRLMQHGLIAQGFRLPRYGADGDWGEETQQAYNAYVAGIELPESLVISNAVIDISHHNNVTDFKLAKADGILGVIHKATQGFRFVDPVYHVRRNQAHDAGLLWGAYHFAEGGDGAGQAEHFLAVVEPGPNDLLVLDLENNPTGSDMSIDDAEEFVDHIRNVTGRWPGLYSGHYIKEKLGNRTDTLLANCWLWIAQYGSRVSVPVAWPTWTLWQYTDGAVGPEPHSVNGVGHCDRDKFKGDELALKHMWLNN